MNKICLLPKRIEYAETFWNPMVYITAWDRWCVAYCDELDIKESLVAVVVEPESEPLKIKDTTDFPFGNNVGNARNLDDAIDMVLEFLEENKDIIVQEDVKKDDVMP